jgi:hypothetical protein
MAFGSRDEGMLYPSPDSVKLLLEQPGVAFIELDFAFEGECP